MDLSDLMHGAMRNAQTGLSGQAASARCSHADQQHLPGPNQSQHHLLLYPPAQAVSMRTLASQITTMRTQSFEPWTLATVRGCIVVGEHPVWWCQTLSIIT